MNTNPPPTPTTGTSLHDILYTFVRHKWKIMACASVGFAAAAAAFFLMPPSYVSEAMLFIRYVTEDAAPGLPGAANEKPIMSLADLERGTTVLQTEVDLLNSRDIADAAVDAVGPERVLTNIKGANTHSREQAAGLVAGNLTVEALPKSTVIHIEYRSSDPASVQPVLKAVVDAYYKKHAEVHQQAAEIGDFLVQETDTLRAQLEQTEDELRKELDKAGIISLTDAKMQFNTEEQRLQADIFAAKADFAEREARYESFLKNSSQVATATAAAAAKGTTNDAAVPPDQVDAFRSLIARLELLQRTEQQLASQFTDQNVQVKNVRAEIADAEQKKLALQSKYPRLAQMVIPAAAPGATPNNGQAVFDPVTEAAYLAGVQSKIKILNAELDQVKASAANVDGLEGRISELQRQRDLQESNYRYYSEHLEATRIDDALGSGRAMNIAQIEQPTPPGTDMKKLEEIVGGLAAGGLVIGLAWAFLIEFYFDRTVRRPVDVERSIGLPLFLSIPNFGKNGHNRHVFHETLRDRLVAFFESQGVTRRPKLIAVTSVGRFAGVTTTASGLARSLSDSRDGNVLLVDMTQSQGSAQQFSQGKPACSMDEMLDTRGNAKVEDNLYVVGAEGNQDQLSKALPSRFNRLVPQLKASDFDYIIFDMPAVNQISITPRLAQYMDMVLLVLESEATDRDIAKQAAVLLSNSRVPVGAVLNKSRQSASKAQHEFLGSGV